MSGFSDKGLLAANLNSHMTEDIRISLSGTVVGVATTVNLFHEHLGENVVKPLPPFLEF